MIVPITLLVAGFGAFVSAQQRNCNCAYETLRPLCGSDGMTYNSACEANCAGVTVQSYGVCDDTVFQDPGSSRSSSRLIMAPASSTRDCPCPAIFQQVCGTNGVTYDNNCLARCANVGVRSQGTCKSAPLTNCVCPYNYSPVCGSNGQTYNNNCLANCAGVGVSRQGACGTATTRAASCMCPTNYAPVCGDDCKQYSNSCQARCAGASVMQVGLCSCVAK